MPKNDAPEIESADSTVRDCAWSGEERDGKHYILTTTAGTELVSEQAFRERSGVAARTHAALVARVDALEKRLQELDQAQQDAGPKGK